MSARQGNVAVRFLLISFVFSVFLVTRPNSEFWAVVAIFAILFAEELTMLDVLIRRRYTTQLILNVSGGVMLIAVIIINIVFIMKSIVWIIAQLRERIFF